MSTKHAENNLIEYWGKRKEGKRDEKSENLYRFQ
jgi:hypothetical protein